MVAHYSDDMASCPFGYRCWQSGDGTSEVHRRAKSAKRDGAKRHHLVGGAVIDVERPGIDQRAAGEHDVAEKTAGFVGFAGSASGISGAA